MFFTEKKGFPVKETITLMGFGSYLTVFPFFVLLATEYFCLGGSRVHDMKTSNVRISFDQHDWDQSF